MSSRHHLAGFNLPAEDHARFQALCRARGSTMRAEIQAILRAQLAHRGCLLSSMLCVRVSPALKQQLTAVARERRVKLATLVRQALVRVLASERDCSSPLA